MRIRSFTAATMPEVMAMVRAEMGENAVILSSERSRRGIEVKAAAEQAPAATLENVDPAYDRLAALEAELERRLIAAVSRPGERPVSALAVAWTQEAVEAKLRFHELPAGLIAQLTADAARLGREPGPDSLAAALDLHLAFAPLPATPENPLILVGQPGAGKTATAARIAVRAALAGHNAALVTTDDSAGAFGQIEAFGALIKLPVESATGPDALAAQVQRLRDQDPNRVIIVDTQGINPFSREELSELGRLIAACGAVAEPVLVTTAQGGRDLEDQAAIFKALGARRLIVNRLDIARRLGGLIAATHASGLAFAQGAASPYIAETMEPLSPFTLARRLLNGDPAATLAEASP